jgi:diaminohydroxyphosphoribosylaminopyrimidine deaminase / 5-amino-6-(5-phosphoribosylamino)uracil reductase
MDDPLSYKGGNLTRTSVGMPSPKRNQTVLLKTTATTLPESPITWSDTDRRMMRCTLELAARGVALVSPGPLVGCVIVNAGGEIVGEGCYTYENVKHAETLALEQAGPSARGATAYVSLEPHAHHSRTPPCTDALLEAGIKRVVVPIEDPNPEVSGKGFDHLRSAGIEVCVGLMAKEAERLNEKYLHFMRTGRPFVHLKMAVSLDGKVATRSGDSRWITGEQARARVHELRHAYDAIMVGGGTVRVDDPLLTDRSGKPRRRPLVRVVIDQCLRMSPESQLVRTSGEAPVLVFTREDTELAALAALQSRGVEVIGIPDDGRGLARVLEELGKRSLQSVLVEGGAILAGLLNDAGLVDKVSFFIAPMIIGGTEAPNAIGGAGAERIADAFQLEDVEISRHGPDFEITGYPVKGMRAEG